MFVAFVYIFLLFFLGITYLGNSMKITIHFKGEWDMMPLIDWIELSDGSPATERDVADLQILMHEGRAFRDWQGLKYVGSQGETRKNW